MSTHIPHDRIAQLSPDKRALLERWRAAQAEQPLLEAPTPRPDFNAPVSLSFAQQRLWFLDQLAPQQPHYNVAAAVRLHGPLDVSQLESALAHVIARHESLRTSFCTVEGQPCQHVHRHVKWSLRQAEVAGSTTDQVQRQIDQLAEEESLQPFDLTRAPLFRATLLSTPDPRLHVLLLTLHHIICDGWSLAVVRQELTHIYVALTKGLPPRLEPPPVQYADYAVWQRNRLTGSTLRSLLDYWSRQLNPLPAPLDLPLDHSRPATQTFRGAVRRLHIDSQRTAALRQLAVDQQGTLFMVLLAAFQTLLARYARQHDVCVGTPIANRRHADLERLVGFFVNTLVLRADLSSNPTVAELLAQVRRTTLDAYEHQELPFERLVDHLQLPRDLSRTPLFQAMFVLQNIPLRTPDAGDLTVAEISFDHAPTSNFDLTLNVDEKPDCLDVSLVFNPDLFQRETADRLLASYDSLLSAFVDDRDQRVLNVPLVSSIQAQSLSFATHATANTATPDCRIESLISAQALRTPQAVAVAADDGLLTYEQLDTRSNRLARYLHRVGVVPGTAVGLCLPRCPDLIVALLAILKSGGCYVPLDPDYPTSRLDYMIRDADLSLVLTQPSLGATFAGAACPIVLLDAIEQHIQQESLAPPSLSSTPDDLAYVIYTSGSTGEPKGVEVTHRGLVNHALVLAQAMQLGTADGMLQYLSLSFDAAGEEIFPTLVSGATLHLHRQPTDLVGHDLLAWTRDRGVNVLHVAPPVWLSLLSTVTSHGRHTASHLKTVLVGGDHVRRADARRWIDLAPPHARFLLAYGVTEATITTTLCDATIHAPPSPSGRLPIGHPIQNNRVYILDEYLQNVPIGVAGELYIAGIGVARGYRNRPELTAQRFLADPFDPNPHARMYRTGDLARRLPDGQIEFLGRIDHQLKIRGHRIEPGEIEVTLAAHPNVLEAAVTAMPDSTGDLRLVAYVVVSNDAITPQKLQSYLATRLPRHLHPATIQPLDQLPHLAGGKIDRRSLPHPSKFDMPPVSDDSPPSNDVERQLAEIWADVLGLPRVGVHDNFFELGGDSIRSIQVIARASACGIRLTPKQLFQHQTIADLATQADTISILAEQGPVTGPVLLTPIQHELFALDPADPHHFNQSVILEVHSDLNTSALQRALHHLISHHDALRHRFFPQPDGSWQQVGLPIDDRSILETVDLSNDPDHTHIDSIRLRIAQCQASLDLSAGPLLQAVYFHLGSGQPGRLFLAIHHLVVDAVSWRILLDDLCLACSQISAQAPVELPRKTTSFAFWANRITAWTNTPATLAQLSYWQSNLTPQLPPHDHNLGEDLVAATDTIELQFDAPTTTHFLHDANHAYRTRPQELLIAALVAALSEHSSTPRIAIDLEGHGREQLFDDLDVSRTVGWFTTLYPVAFDATKSSAAEKLVCQTKERLRTVPQAGLSYGALRWLAPPNVQAQLSSQPRPYVSFNYLGHFDHLLPERAPFSLADESTALDRSPRGRRPHTWDILAYIRHDRLHLRWSYSANRHRRDTIERLVTAFDESLHALLEHCLTPGVGKLTPSDFPLARIQQDELDRLATRLDEGRHTDVADPHDIDDILPLAPLQQLMLTHALTHPRSELLVEQLHCRLEGSLDDTLLNRAWQSVVARHPLLRACFTYEGLEYPVQVIQQCHTMNVEILDLRQQPSDQREQSLVQHLDDERRRAFELDRAPLHRLKLIRTADDHACLVWTCHHLITDGWSLGVVLRDLFTSYASLRRSHSLDTSTQPGFRNFIAWLARQDSIPCHQAWDELLHDSPPPLHLSIQHEPTNLATAETRHATHESRLARDLTRRLADTAVAHRVGLATIVEAAWAILLSRYGQQQDLVYGVAVAGRPPSVPNLDHAVGPFMNNIPRRVQLSDDLTTTDLFQHLATQQLALQPYESTPLDVILCAAKLPTGRQLFDTLFVFENYPLHRALSTTVDSLTVTQIHGTASSNYLLSLIVLPGDELTLRLNFDTQRCDAAATRRLFDQLAVLLEALSSSPNAPLSTISMSNAAMRAELYDYLQAHDGHRVLNSAHQPLPWGIPGELWVAVDCNSTLPATILDPLDPHQRNGLRSTGYRARLDDEHGIEYLGPTDAPTRIDGHSVNFNELNAVVSLHPLVQQSAIVDLPDRMGRDRLAAFIVPTPHTTSVLESQQHGLLLDQVRRFAAHRLPPALFPRMWRVLPELPLTAQGTIDRDQLPALTNGRRDSLAGYVAPRDPLEARLCAIWSELLDIEPIGIADSFLDLGGYSSQAVSLLARLEDEFGRRLPLGSLFDHPTVERLARALRHDDAPREITLVPLRPTGQRPPLFCIHPAGGTVFCYRQLARHLDESIPVYGLQAVGLDGLSPPHDSIETMAAHYAEAIRSADPVGPYQLCGWSTGGIIAFETARQLRQQRCDVACVALFDAGLPRQADAFDQRDLDAQLQLLFPGEAPERWAELRRRSPAEQLAEFRRRAEAAHLVMNHAAQAQAKHVYEVFQANMHAVVTYQPQPYDGPLVLLRAAQQTTPMHVDPTLGWQPWAIGGIQAYDVAASHLEMLQPPAISQVAQLLSPHLIG